jgi:hypothetical protein
VQARGRFFEKKLRKKLLLPGDVATPHVKGTKKFWRIFKSDRLLAFLRPKCGEPPQTQNQIAP